MAGVGQAVIAEDLTRGLLYEADWFVGAGAAVDD
jgi:hypothetical protein